MPNPKAPKSAYKTIDPSAYTTQFDRFERQGAYGNDIWNNGSGTSPQQFKDLDFSSLPGVRDIYGNNVYTNKNGSTVVKHPGGKGWVDVGNPNSLKFIGDTSTSESQSIINPSISSQVKTPITLNPIDNTPARKPLDFGSPSGIVDPNTGSSYSNLNNYNSNKSIVPIVQNKSKGGLIAKVRGYDDGGAVTPGQKNALLGSGLQGAGNITSSLTTDQYGRTNTGSKTGDYAAGIGAGALSGAAMGSVAGPYGTLIGAGVGGVLGGIKTYKGEQSIDKEKKAIALNSQQVADAKMNNLWQANQATQLQNRGYNKGGMVAKIMGYSMGGEIKGKGTETSDSINAKVQPGSYVIPAKNAPIAEEIRKKILPPTLKKKADLNQAGGEPVKLSNNEHIFTPEERAEIEKYGYDLDALAPNSDDNMGKANGGLTAEKAKIMLSDNQANGKSLTPLQKRYFSYIAGGGEPHKNGGVVGYDNGGKVKQLTLQQYAALSPKDRMAYDAAKNGKAVVNSNVPLQSKGKTVAPKYLLNPNLNARTLPTTNTNVELQGNNNIVPTEANGLLTPTKKSGGFDSKKAMGILGAGKDMISNLTNYVIPYKQTQMGLDYLNKSGARPVDMVDPNFQNTVNKANANAMFGFSPEEQAYNNNVNLSQLEAQKNAARNYSGGSAASALNGERMASNYYFNNALKASVANKNLQLDKTQYADQLNVAKANKMRQLFDDKMNAFNTNQQAGSTLLNSGLTNAIGAKMYSDELNMMKQSNNIGS